MATINIYVGNLSLEVTEEELRREFTVFGEVTSVVIMNDKYMVMNNRYIGSGQTRGYGYVEMASKDEGEAAIISLNGKRLKSQVIDVVGALPLSEKKALGSPHGRVNNRLNRRVR